MEPGEIVDLDGRVRGTHQGIAHFTVGPAQGLGIASGSPLYVCGSMRDTPRRVARARPADGPASGFATQLDRRRRDRPARWQCLEVLAGALDRAPQPAWLRGATAITR